VRKIYLDILLHSLILFGIYVLVNLGLNILWGLLKIVNIAHGDIIMAGAYLTYWLYNSYGISPLISMFLSVVTFGFLGPLIYLGLLHEVLERAEMEVSLLIFWGIGYVIQGTILALFGGVEKAYKYLMTPIQVLDASIMLNRVVVFTIAVIACFAFSIFLYKTLTGKAIRACFQDKLASLLVGINLKRISILSFAIAFGITGLTGSLMSLMYTLEPFMGLSYTMIAFTITVIGGVGEMKGAVVGALILSVAHMLTSYLASPGLSMIVLYAILITTLVVKPKGLFGK